MTDYTENDLIDGIAPTTIEHASPIEKKKFSGWHKPRKQWVRRNQWRNQIESLIPRLKLDGRPLRYLSLPGEDMLDIRLIADLCKSNGLQLKCLGYDEEARNRTSQTEVNISWNEVSNNIMETSTLLPDNIAVLGNKHSQAFDYVDKLGPFDVINLDLCGAISCVENPAYHEVLKNLCEYQVNNHREPWLLFITTRAEYAQVNLEHMPSYLNNVKENAAGSATFGERLYKVTGFNIQTYNNTADLRILFEHFPGENFVRLFAVGFSKWLLKLMPQGSQGWKIEMLDTCQYRVEDNQSASSFPNMLSLAFCFSPVDFSLHDKSGLTSANPQPALDEAVLALTILDKTETATDLDVELDKNESLFNTLLTESATLLKSARYEINGYKEWAESRRIHFETN